MDKSIFEAFLLRTAIPKAKTKSKIPECVGEESNLLWDCIWSAHCDVLDGYRYLGQTAADKFRELDIKLYGLIFNHACALNSRALINELYGVHVFAEKIVSSNSAKRTAYGAIQKLVNMTLKYILILQSYGVQDGSLPRINPQDCDCPLDSRILESLGCKNAKWTQLEERKYCAIESDIGSRVLSEDEEWGRISYDFRNWPPKNDRIRRHDR